MVVLALLVLFAPHYFVSLAISTAPVECSSAESAGKCREIHLNQSRCHNSFENYRAMEERCCHNTRSAECSSVTLSDSQWSSSRQCSQMMPTTSPSHAIPSLSPLRIDCSTFSLNASWPEMRNVSGYKLAVYANKFLLGCFCTSKPRYTSIILSTLCYDGTQSTLNVMLWKTVAGVSVLVGHSFIKRKNCYSLYTDPAMQLNYCGYNISAKLDSSSVHMSSVSAVDGLVDTTLSWPPVRDAQSYELLMKDGKGRKMWFNATNTTQVTLTGLTQNTTYSMRIRPYMECAGQYLEEYQWEPCTGTSFPLSPSVTIPLSSTLSTTSNASTSVAVSSQPLFTESNATATTFQASPSIHSPANASPLIAGVGVALAVMLAVVLFLLVCVLCCKPVGRKLPSPELDEPSQYDTCDDPSVPGITVSGYIQYPCPVVVLYSLRTPEQQRTTINNLLVGGLAEQGVSVETPGTARPRAISRDWLEVKLRQVKAVLLVCNQQFYEEWTGTCPEGDCKLQVGREVKLLTNCLKDLDKVAYVYFEKTDLDTKYPHLSSYIQTRFSLAGNNIHATLHSIAKFVHNIPEFELN